MIKKSIPLLTASLLTFLPHAQAASPSQLLQNLQQSNASLETKLIDWRRDIHANPELSNREFKTAEKVASHLKSLGMDVETGIAHTGVVGLLKGAQPGPTIAIRADMDALPVTEEVDIPFASKATSTYRGETVGVMHACGHDAHVAILMAIAESFSKMKDDLKGNIVFIFQPAEEGAPHGEEGGAELMLAEGLFKKYQPEAVFGLHVTSSLHVGTVGYRPGPAMAAVDDFIMKVKGVQTHGSRPWHGIDPIVTAAQIINSTQTIISRHTDITKGPAVVSFGAIKGGIRNNIIPDSVEMVGTIRNFDMKNREKIHKLLKHNADLTAKAAGAEVETIINIGYPVTYNNEQLTEDALPVIKQAGGVEQVIKMPLITGAEDFSFFAREVPGFYFFLGVSPKSQDLKTAPSNHSPRFYIDESGLMAGVNALSVTALNYLNTH